MYVGGTGPNNYTKIQDAIRNASDGDTVFVFDESSPYNESVKVYRSINIIGEDKNTTIIDAKNKLDGLIIDEEDNVRISGFTIKNVNRSGILVIKSSYTNITDNNIINNREIGIHLIYSPKSSIINNNVLSNEHGIHLDLSSHWTVVKNNNISLNWEEGIVSLSSGHTITENVLEYNGFRDHIMGYAINIIIGETVTIENNIVRNNFMGIQISDGSGINKIAHNHIENNELKGVCIDSISGNTFIVQNNFINNSCNAIMESIQFYPFFSIRYISNYWDDWIGFGPYPIFRCLGPLGIIPWYTFDWHPAKEPYDI